MIHGKVFLWILCKLEFAFLPFYALLEHWSVCVFSEYKNCVHNLCSIRNKINFLTVTLPTDSTEPKGKNFTCNVFIISTHFSSLEVWLLTLFCTIFESSLAIGNRSSCALRLKTDVCSNANHLKTRWEIFLSIFPH